MEALVKTADRHLRGRLVDGVHEFLGVPYAAPPAGRNRLRPPQPVEPWTVVRDATRIGPVPPQVAPPQSVGFDWDTEVMGEDCLTPQRVDA